MFNPSPQEIADNYKKVQERFALYKNFGYDMEKERTFILVKSLPLKGDILEIGTGKGLFSVILAKAGYHFTSIDISEEDQKFAIMNLQYYSLLKSVNLRIENAENLSFSNMSFDVILCVNVIHHLRNPYKVTDEMLRIIKPEGKLIISDFSAKGFEIMDDINNSEGKKHDVNDIYIKNIEKYLTDKGLYLEKSCSEMQEILIVKKQENI